MEPGERASQQLDRRVLVTFFGTLDRRGDVTTIGDLMAVYNVGRSLRRAVRHVNIAWHGNLFDLNGCRVGLGALGRRGYDAIVYVCGPITRGHKNFFSRFPSVKKIAVGVSITDDIDPWSFLDAVYARDSEAEASFDLALADIGYPHFAADGKVRDDKIALCLVGEQVEYGSNDGHDRAAALIDQAGAGRQTVPVQTLLDQNRPIPASVEIDLQCASSLITTRMHGALLAIYHRVPVLAVDQIRGGAKVTRIVGQLEWPVFNAWTATAGELSEQLDEYRRHYPAQRLEHARALLVKRSREALDASTDFILEQLRNV